jgi:hypothetical protein
MTKETNKLNPTKLHATQIDMEFDHTADLLLKEQPFQSVCLESEAPDVQTAASDVKT